MIHRARRYHREFLEESRATSDPTLRAVFVEDAVSVSGDVITLAALALNQITGSSIPQGVAAVGPGRAWVVARLDIDDDLRGAEVKSLVRGIESGMKRESENVYRVDIVPTGGVTI